MNDPDNGVKSEGVDPFIHRMAARKLQLDALMVSEPQPAMEPFSHGVTIPGIPGKSRSR